MHLGRSGGDAAPPVGHSVGRVAHRCVFVVFAPSGIPSGIPSAGVPHCIFTAFRPRSSLRFHCVLRFRGIFGAFFRLSGEGRGKWSGGGRFGGKIACFSPVVYRGVGRGRFLLRFFCVLPRKTHFEKRKVKGDLATHPSQIFTPFPLLLFRVGWNN